jgi:hypothetical protein
MYPTNNTTTLDLNHGETSAAYDVNKQLILSGDAICTSTNVAYNFSGSRTLVNNELVCKLEENNGAGVQVSSSFFAVSGSTIQVRLYKGNTGSGASSASVKIRYI